MMRWGWERLAALAGVVAVALWVIGVLIQESTDMPGDEPTGEEVLAWYSGDENAILAGGFVFILGALFFLIFLGALRVRLLDAEGPRGFLTAIGYTAGLGAGFFLLPGGWQPPSLGLGVGAAVFAVMFYLLREAFKRRSGGVGFRP